MRKGTATAHHIAGRVTGRGRTTQATAVRRAGVNPEGTDAQSPSGSELDQRIAALEETVGTMLYRWVLREYGHANQPHLVRDIQAKEEDPRCAGIRHTRFGAYGSSPRPRSRTTGQRLAGEARSSSPS
jgi:hypothetical protein